MTDWTPETDMNIAHKERVSLEFGLGVAYNPRAMFEGAADAPRMNPLALGDLTAGDTLSCGAQTEVELIDSAPAVTVFTFNCMQGGTVRVKGQARGDNSLVDTTWYVYRVRAGTQTLIGSQTISATSYTSFTAVDVSIQYGDLIRVDAYSEDLPGTGNGDVRNVSIHTDGTQPIWTTSNFGYIYV